MIEKYTISFSVEAELKDKDELAAMVWTLLKIGKQALGEVPMTVPALKEINVEVGFCDEPYEPFRLYLLPSKDAPITEDMVPACTAFRFQELRYAINDYIAQGKIITVFYISQDQSEGECVYCYSPQSSPYKDYTFFKEHPDLA